MKPLGAATDSPAITDTTADVPHSSGVSTVAGVGDQFGKASAGWVYSTV